MDVEEFKEKLREHLNAQITLQKGEITWELARAQPKQSRVNHLKGMITAYENLLFGLI